MTPLLFLPPDGALTNLRPLEAAHIKKVQCDVMKLYDEYQLNLSPSVFSPAGAHVLKRKREIHTPVQKEAIKETLRGFY